jgi:hypothetical protein
MKGLFLYSNKLGNCLNITGWKCGFESMALYNSSGRFMTSVPQLLGLIPEVILSQKCSANTGPGWVL